MRIDAELRFEIISSCCAVLGGGVLAAVVTSLSPWNAWTTEVAVTIGILCGLIAVVVHMLVREMCQVEIERHIKRTSELAKPTFKPDSPVPPKSV